MSSQLSGLLWMLGAVEVQLPYFLRMQLINCYKNCGAAPAAYQDLPATIVLKTLQQMSSL